MTNDGWIAVLAYAVIFLPFVVATVGSFLWVVFQTKRNPPTEIYEPYGDATDTPQMRLNTRRVNFKREDA
jgi:hypothetical protein